MPKDLTREIAPVGDIVYEWWVKEYEQHDRSRRWYIVMGALALFCILYGMFTNDYLFALIIVLLGIILYLHELQEPLMVYFAITQTGIILGKKYYRFGELKNFWVLYNPPIVKNIYFSLDNAIKYRLVVPLLDFDPRPIREYLGQFIDENTEIEEEPFIDQLARVLKLH